MKFFLSILLLFFTWFSSSATIAAPKIVVPTNTSIFLKTEKVIRPEKAKIGIENFARSSLEEQQAQTTTFHQNTCLLSSYLKEENSCALDFQETVSTNQVLFAQFSKKEALCLLENRAREELCGVVNSAGKVLTSKPSWLPNRIISGNINNAKGLIGVYDKNIPGLGIIDDTKRMLSEIDFPMCNASNFKTASKNGFKLLNVPNDAVDMWATYNKPWIEALTNAKAEITVLSDKGNDLLKYAINTDGTFKLVNGQKVLTGFGKEIDFMETLVQQGKYQFDNVAGSYKYIGN